MLKPTKRVLPGCIQILKCIIPTAQMEREFRSEKDLDIKNNYHPIPGLLPQPEFTLMGEVATWFENCCDDLGWPSGWNSFDIINVVIPPSPNGNFKGLILAYMLVEPDIFKRSKWMAKAYNEISNMDNFLEKDFWMLTLKSKLPLIKIPSA